MPYVSEDERVPFDVRNASPEQVEAYIGDLKVEIERLCTLLDEIAEIAHRPDVSGEKPESD
jgi:hypothetical protein